MGVGDDRKLAVHRAVIEVEEALRLAVTHHVALSGSVRDTLVSFTCGSRSFSFKGFWPWSARSASIARSRSAQ
ncbi:hypothetical protein GGE12_002236 [Rhizobium mongolense]|uniref:Uncharacterized protein n=1 Tax=Rhizobium mongolense TaxID=57676 RepID=A0A7W6WE47_9HYPH|nr:hypothetical protein [Rhizobium mongolense]